METIAFDNAIICNHELYSYCGSTLHDVSEKDYPNKVFFDKSIACLDIDKYEKQVGKGNNKETVDAVIGVKNYRQNSFTDLRLLLVELRMGYKSERGLSKTKLEDKVIHTREHLGTVYKVDSQNWFIFSNGVINRVKHWFNNKSKEGGLIKTCKPLSIDEFNEIVKCENDFPYIPITNLEALKLELTNLYSSDVSSFLRAIKHWLDEALRYDRKYNIEESRHIRTVVVDVWRAFRASKFILSDDEILDVEILEEDNSCLVKYADLK